MVEDGAGGGRGALVGEVGMMKLVLARWRSGKQSGWQTERDGKGREAGRKEAGYTSAMYPSYRRLCLVDGLLAKAIEVCCAG